MNTASNLSLEIQHLNKSFYIQSGLFRSIAQLIRTLGQHKPSFSVLEDINISIQKGECVGLVGKNGSGKSTLLKCIAGNSVADSGNLFVDGKLLALLTHGFGAYEDIMVKKNFQICLQLFGYKAKEAEERVLECAKIAGLSERLLSPTSQLSEGMRAKIPLACLQLASFDILLLDESLNHIDIDFKTQFLETCKKWQADGKTILITSHDDQILHSFCNRFLLFQNKKIHEYSNNKV
ncbi:MAG: ATP-binding cassette domain-containing protein [Oligoflexia bacterium]|nr:ATP-binding cassette domain-containing protein [Oligoflexia bacterium]